MNGEHHRAVFVLSKTFRLIRARSLVLLVCVLCPVVVARAQQQQNPDPPIDYTPPPMKYVPEETRQQLSLEKDAKARTKRSLELAEERLERAAAQTSSEQYEAAGRELGIYQAIIQDAIRYIQESVKKDGKRRDLFKRMELSLRAHMPRLETIRRTTPSEDAIHVKSCMDFVRGARVEALNSFYDDTVIRMPETKSEKPRNEGSNAKGASLDAPQKKPEQP